MAGRVDVPGKATRANRIRRVTAQDGRSVEVDVADRLPTLVDGDVNVRLELPESATVRTNHMFVEAMEELVRNAVEHNDGESPKLDVSVDRAAGPLHLVEVSIADNGPGIPEHVVSILQGSETDQLTHLQGMGLWFVLWVIAEWTDT